jgi:fumarate reductase (CoM/CoB) subunit A
MYDQEQYKWTDSGGCSWKTHTFNAASPLVGHNDPLDEYGQHIHYKDSVEAHVSDTIKGGANAGNPELVRIMCETAPSLLQWLEEMGVEIENERKPYGGCQYNRAITSQDDILGFYITRAMRKRVEMFNEKNQLRIIQPYRAIELLKEDKNVIGVRLCHMKDEASIYNLYSDAVILADGGGTTMYATRSSTADKTCDGMYMAFMGGCELIDMEMIQFHPTGLVSNEPTFHGSLVEEIVRFEGGLLKNKNGEVCVHGTQTRDKVNTFTLF